MLHTVKTSTYSVLVRKLISAARKVVVCNPISQAGSVCLTKASHEKFKPLKMALLLRLSFQF